VVSEGALQMAQARTQTPNSRSPFLPYWPTKPSSSIQARRHSLVRCGQSKSPDAAPQPGQTEKSIGKSYHGGGPSKGFLPGSSFHARKGGVWCRGYSKPHWQHTWPPSACGESQAKSSSFMALGESSGNRHQPSRRSLNQSAQGPPQLSTSAFRARSTCSCSAALRRGSAPGRLALLPKPRHQFALPQEPSS
jgi:hypothetical protein